MIDQTHTTDLALDDGYHAQRAGYRIADCPHWPGSADYITWCSEWRRGEREDRLAYARVHGSVFK